MKFIKFSLIALVLVAFQSPPADVKLEYSFKAGDEYVVKQTSKQTIKQTFGGTEQKMESNNETESTVKVIEITATGAKLESTYTRMKTQSNNPMGTNVLDSEGAPELDETKIYKALVNKPIYIYLSKAGKVEKVEGVENLWKDFDALAMDAQKKKIMKETLQMQFNEETLVSGFQSTFVNYPEKKVKIGEKWTLTHNVSSPLPMQTQNTWSVESVNGAEAKLSSDGTTSSTDKDKVVNLPAGIKAKTDLAGQQAMKSTVNTKSGWPVKHEMLAEIKGKMTLLAGGMIPQDMEVPMEIIAESSSTITKK
jgi:hypothetical protein